MSMSQTSRMLLEGKQLQSVQELVQELVQEVQEGLFLLDVSIISIAQTYSTDDDKTRIIFFSTLLLFIVLCPGRLFFKRSFLFSLFSVLLLFPFKSPMSTRPRRRCPGGAVPLIIIQTLLHAILFTSPSQNAGRVVGVIIRISPFVPPTLYLFWLFPSGFFLVCSRQVHSSLIRF
jgi:hypothetical protein